MRWSSVFAVCIGLSACGDRSAIKPSDSLVGAKDLPTAEVLSREIIQINRGLGSWPSAPGALEYDLQPDNSLSITHTKVDRNRDRVIAGKETLHLSSNTAAQARRILWRLRPETLQGIEVEKLPTGCEPAPIDSSPEYFVNFISEGPKPGIADDKLGIVLVPYGDHCRTAQAAEARELVQRVLQTFPPSNVAADFDKEVSRWKSENGL